MTFNPSPISSRQYLTVGASAAYPVLSLRVDDQPLAPAYGPAARRLQRTLTAVCLAVVQPTQTRPQLRDLVRADLCRIGEAVTLHQLGGNFILPAAGDAGLGSLPGFPTVAVADEGDGGAGGVLRFTVTASAVIPLAADEDGLVEHDSRTEDSVSLNGLLTITQTGTIVTDAVSAKDYFDTVVAAAFRLAAAAANDAVESRVTITPDDRSAQYTLIRRQRVGGAVGVADAAVTRLTTADNSGRVVFRVSGSATGDNATTFAQAQRPTTVTGEILTRADITPPQTPTGRVDFTYEVLSGTTLAIEGLTLISWEETIADVSPGVPISVAPFYIGEPVLIQTIDAGYAYTQTVTLTYIGDDAVALAAASAPEGFAPDLLSGAPRVNVAALSDGTRRMTVSRQWVYALPIATLPSPRRKGGTL